MADARKKPDDGEERDLPAPSYQAASDWVLVLASQSIPCRIERNSLSRKWRVVVPSSWADAAIEQIRISSTRDALPLPEPDPEPPPRIRWRHPAVLIWAMLCVAVHLACGREGHPWREFAVMSSDGFARGELWRLATAVFLHVDGLHLAANLVSGIVLLGLALTRSRPRVLFTVGWISGILGNWAGWWIHSHPYRAMGASGMILGWLGWMAIQPISGKGVARFPSRQALAGGILLFVFLGVSPSGDVVAHGAGFLAGLAMAFAARILFRLPDLAGK